MLNLNDKRHKQQTKYLRMKIFSFNSELTKVTGVQKVLLDIHRAVKEEYDAKIVGTVPYELVDPNLKIARKEYVRFKNPFMFRKSIVIVHERKFLLMFWLLNHVLFQRIKLVYIHHNVFYSHRRLSVMPKTVIAISDEGVENLKTYFRVPARNIHKIYNCVIDVHPKPRTYRSLDTITLLYPARINKVKRQIEVYRHLKDELDKRIRIVFVGEGPYLSDLRQEIDGDERFVSLGFRSDVIELLQQCDYMMLFSSQEGLPITLIEAAMCGTPIVCNNVGGNCEIAIDGKNAFVVNDWDELIHQLNSLFGVSSETWLHMSKSSRKIFEERFTFEKLKSNYLALLNTL